MRTTLNLPDALGARAKERARRDGRTFTSLVEEGLRAVLDAPAAPPEGLPALPRYGTPGAAIHVDIIDSTTLWPALDDRGLK